MRYKRKLVFRLVLALVCTMSLVSVGVADQDRGEERIRQSLAQILPDIKIDELTPSPVPGLYEVVIGQKLVYATDDGKYLLQGNLIDLEQQENITQKRVSAIKAGVIQGLDETQMVIFGSPDAPYTVSVFTDIDCGYCRQFHSEIASYLDKGIRVRYLFFPRAGVDSDSYRKAVSVWCADDRRQAMTLAKQGRDIESRDCPNPVKVDMGLGAQMGVSGTPTIVLNNGHTIPGYVPADRLLAILQQQDG
ncbi:MAG: DsbC family protein [Gammaproteobacteria bacterium]|nr:DsbC family protein [Gammaproteobacteria bacterium]